MDDKRLERIEDKIDALSTHLGSIDITLAKQNVTLEDHVRRTTLLEKALIPIRRHIDMVSGALKLIGLVGIIVGIFAAIKALL